MTVDPLLVDVYAEDGRGPADVHRLAAAGAPWHGVMFKATHGRDAAAPDWLAAVWREAHGVDCSHTRDRLGRDWWVLPYGYWLAHQPWLEQADAMLREVSRVGGWRHGTGYPVIDVEGGNQLAGVTANQVVDNVSRIAERLRDATSRDVVVYVGNWLRELFLAAGVKSKMGCRYVWPAAYTAQLDPGSVTDIGFKFPSEMLAWQFNGDGKGLLAGYPQLSPLGPEDISALTIAGGGAAALEHMRTRAWPCVS